MKKITCALVAAVLATAFIGTIITSVYTYSLSVKLDRIKRSAYNESVYLSTRFRAFKNELNAALDERLEEMESTVSVALTETAPPKETEAVTLPTLLTPETEPETVPAMSLYIVAEHEGIIGIFDATGILQKTVNVFVMTLPEADREALAVGLAVYSWEEAVEMAERFE